MSPNDLGNLEISTTPSENCSELCKISISQFTGQMSMASVNSDRSWLDASTGQQAAFPSGHTA